MKKMKLSVLILVGGLFMSCEKEYTCSCSQYDSSLNKTVNRWSTTETMSESDAKAWCNGNQLSGFGLTTTCTLN